MASIKIQQKENHLTRMLEELNSVYGTKHPPMRQLTLYFDQGLFQNILNEMEGNINDPDHLREGLERVFRRIYTKKEDTIKNKPALATSFWRDFVKDVNAQSGSNTGDDRRTLKKDVRAAEAIWREPVASSSWSAMATLPTTSTATATAPMIGGQNLPPPLPLHLPPSLSEKNEEEAEEAEEEVRSDGVFREEDVQRWRELFAGGDDDDRGTVALASPTTLMCTFPQPTRDISSIQKDVEHALANTGKQLSQLSSSSTSQPEWYDIDLIIRLRLRQACLSTFATHLQEQIASACQTHSQTDQWIPAMGCEALAKYIIHGDVSDVRCYLRSLCRCCTHEADGCCDLAMLSYYVNSSLMNVMSKLKGSKYELSMQRMMWGGIMCNTTLLRAQAVLRPPHPHPDIDRDQHHA